MNYFYKKDLLVRMIISYGAMLTSLVATPIGVPTASTQVGSTAQPLPSDLENVEDRQFRCPEKLPNIVEKEREVKSFLVWVKNYHPDWSREQMLNFRISVLKYYGCNKTLNNIGAAKP